MRMRISVRTHPGAVLREEYLKPLGMSAQRWPRPLACHPTG